MTPFIGLSTGYAFDVTNDFEGVGVLLAFSAGVNFAISDKNFMHVALGIDSQTMEFYDAYYGSYGDTWTEVSNAISLNVGFSF